MEATDSIGVVHWRHAVSLALFEELKRHVGFGPADAEVLRAFHPQVQPRFPGIVEEFYRHILEHEGTRRILQDSAQVERLKKTLLAWLGELFQGPHDAAYYEKRARIGLTHVRIGLPQAYVFTAMADIHRNLGEAIQELSQHDPARLRQGNSALAKILHLELALIAGSYHEAEKYRDLVESAPEMIHSVDREGRFVSVNRTEERHLGFSHDELLRMKLEDIVLPEDRQTIRDHLARVFRDGESRCEVRLATANGKHLEVEILATGVRDPLDEGIIRTRAYVRDVTERNLLARRLTERASLSRLGEMAAIVAHEVKNPLAGIGGAIQVIGSHLPLQSTDKAIIGEILERIDALNGTLQDLLLYARPRLPRPAPVRLRAILSDTASLLSQDPALARIEVAISGTDLTVPADAELLKPVFLNLLINAGQAMGGRGQVEVRIQAVDGQARIAVIDRGPGIPPEIRQKIFEPFFSTKHRGSGLGLPIAKRVIELHQGTITVECPSKGGTVVTVALPQERTRGASS